MITTFSFSTCFFCIRVWRFSEFSLWTDDRHLCELWHFFLRIVRKNWKYLQVSTCSSNSLFFQKWLWLSCVSLSLSVGYQPTEFGAQFQEFQVSWLWWSGSGSGLWTWIHFLFVDNPKRCEKFLKLDIQLHCILGFKLFCFGGHDEDPDLDYLFFGWTRLIVSAGSNLDHSLVIQLFCQQSPRSSWEADF